MRSVVNRNHSADAQVRWLLSMLREHGHSGIPTGAELSRRNRTHGPTTSGGRSDHQGPRHYAWAADLPAGSLLEGDRLAGAIADHLGLREWPGEGIHDAVARRYRYQLIWRAAGHFDHVHIGIRREGRLPPVALAFR